MTDETEAAEKARAERIFKERLDGSYTPWPELKFRELIATRDAGKSLARVKNVGAPSPLTLRERDRVKSVARQKVRWSLHLAPNTASRAGAPRRSLRNQLCPCGSGRKAKYCCIDQ